MLIGLSSLCFGPGSSKALPSPRRVGSFATGALAGHLAPLGRAEGLPDPPTLPVGPCTTPSTQGFLLAVPLYMAPFEALEALPRLQGSPVGFTIQYLGPPDHSFLTSPAGLSLALNSD